MAYDEVLAERTRAVVAALAPADEKKMFGGLAFMVNTHLACGLIGDGLLVRVGEDAYEAALARGAEEMTRFSGRPMRGFVIVQAPALAQQSELMAWVHQGVDWALSQDPKPPNTARAPRVKRSPQTR